MAIRPDDTATFAPDLRLEFPAKYLRKYGISAGTQAIIQETPEGILVRPLSAKAIDEAHGMFPLRPGEKPLLERWAEYKKEEQDLESRKFDSPR